ncbi:MAG: MoaD/ThiS family protein [Caldilineaceae bacterium]
MTTVFIPTPMRRLTNGQSKVAIDGSTVRGLIQAMDQTYPGMAQRLLDEQGAPKRFINIFLNDDGIDALQGMDTPVRDGDRISIVPALAGGA